MGNSAPKCQACAASSTGGITEGLWGYEAGQSGVGDIFGWFTKTQVPPTYFDAAQSEGLSLHEYLTKLATSQQVGEHGLVALDWHSGNRSVLVDHELSGVVVGQTLATRPEDTYRALLEATAFGTRRIIEAFNESGVPVSELVVAGGLLKKPLTHANLCRRDPPSSVDHCLDAGSRARRGHPCRRRGWPLSRREVGGPDHG